MPKVDYKDLEEVARFLDKIRCSMRLREVVKAQQLSKMIKDKYTEIKPDYDK